MSNHSYGYALRDEDGNVILPSIYLGAYINESRNWDNIMYNAPYYLMVVAAGNDGFDDTANSEPLGGATAFDKLSGHATSKNNLVVANANDAIINVDGTLQSVSKNGSSSEGPTDDYRIKPDITGNGTQLYSSYQSADDSYNSITGTSMASPNVTGSLLLLQEHYFNLYGTFMLASTLKGLALHTADDAGDTGPDANFGWGLLNTKKAAEALTSAAANSGSTIVKELTLNQGDTYELIVQSNGIDPLLASISWTDIGGTVQAVINDNTPRLVNDLDVRLNNGSVYTPWKLTSVDSNGKGDNTVDPYERIDINGASGFYTLTVSHKGSLNTGSQNFSLIVSGVDVQTVTWSGATNNDWDTSTNWSDGVTPTSTDNVIIPGNLINYPISSAPVSVNSVTIASGSSLIAQSSFSGNITYNRSLATDNWYLVSSPVTGETYDDAYVTANGIDSWTESNRAIAVHTASNNTWDYMQTGANDATFIDGIGYAVKRSSAGDISFTGTMNTDDDGVDIVLSSAGKRFNLLGNPYTSHIDSATFLNEELAISETKTLWVWNQALGASGAYDVKTIADDMVIAPTQGFFVKANTSGGTFNFAQSNQVSIGGTFQRTEARPKIHLTLSNGTDSKEARVYYIENMTTGFDVGYEGELFDGVSNSLAIYTHLITDSEGKNYQVQSLPNNDFENMIIPVGINAESGTTITIDASKSNFPSGINIYLENKEDNTFTLLQADANYSTTLENSLFGIGRFYLHTTSLALSADDLAINNNISIYKSSNDNLRIVGVQNGTSNLQMFDILGKVVLKTSFEGNGINDIKLNYIPMGIYIVKLITTSGVISKKIIVN